MVKRKISGGSSQASSLNSISQATGARAMNPRSLISSLSVIAFLSPYILISFFLLLSIFNSNAKGIMYFMGVVILAPIIAVLSRFYLPTTEIKACNFFGDFLNDIPSFSTSLYSYTFFYLAMAMINSNIMNMALVILLLLMGAADAAIRLNYECTNIKGIIFGIILGGIIGTGWYLVMSQTSPKLLYFEEYVSNKVACSVPRKQAFKCRLFKDGVEIDIASNTGPSVSQEGGGDHSHFIDNTN